MDKFSVGEIAVLISPTDVNVEFQGKAGPGTECELMKYEHDFHEGPGWWCLFEGDPSPSVTGWWWVAQRCLRKKKPPQELTTWEAVQEITGWNPSKVTENA